MKLNIA